MSPLQSNFKNSSDKPIRLEGEMKSTCPPSRTTAAPRTSRTQSLVTELETAKILQELSQSTRSPTSNQSVRKNINAASSSVSSSSSSPIILESSSEGEDNYHVVGPQELVSPRVKKQKQFHSSLLDSRLVVSPTPSCDGDSSSSATIASGIPRRLTYVPASSAAGTTINTSSNFAWNNASGNALPLLPEQFVVDTTPPDVDSQSFMTCESSVTSFATTSQALPGSIHGGLMPSLAKTEVKPLAAPPSIRCFSNFANPPGKKSNTQTANNPATNVIKKQQGTAGNISKSPIMMSQTSLPGAQQLNQTQSQQYVSMPPPSSSLSTPTTSSAPQHLRSLQAQAQAAMAMAAVANQFQQLPHNSLEIIKTLLEQQTQTLQKQQTSSQHQSQQFPPSPPPMNQNHFALSNDTPRSQSPIPMCYPVHDPSSVAPSTTTTMNATTQQSQLQRNVNVMAQWGTQINQQQPSSTSSSLSQNPMNMYRQPQPQPQPQQQQQQCQIITPTPTNQTTKRKKGSSPSTVSSNNSNKRKRKICKMDQCYFQAAERTPYCTKHAGQRKCEHISCTKFAQGKTRYCIAHGGGRRCIIPNCNRGARDQKYCAAHGGGRRCNVAKCTKMAVGKGLTCTAHGGGRRCQVENCTKSAQSSSDFCVRHGGGKKCVFRGCSKVARGKIGMCMAHATLSGVTVYNQSPVKIGSTDSAISLQK